MTASTSAGTPDILAKIIQVKVEEVAAACSRVIIIDRGRIVANDTPAALAARSPEGKLEDVFREITLPDTVHDHVKPAAVAEVSA